MNIEHTVSNLHFETALKESKERYRRLIDSARDVIFTISMDGLITSLNPIFETITGWEQTAWVGKPFAAILHPDDIAEALQRVRLTMTGEILPPHEWRIHASNGEYLWAEITSTPEYADGQIVGLLGIARDITERKRLQSQLEEAERKRSDDLQRFVISIQQAQEDERRRIARELHDDIGQKLSGLKIAVDLASYDSSKTSRTLRRKLSEIEADIDRIIDDVRRISANLHPAVLDDFGLPIALPVLCKEFQKVYRLPVTINETPAARYSPHVEINLYRIAQEALTNVVKHSAATQVTVRLFNQDDSVCLEVWDNGRGFEIDTQRLRRITRTLGLISMRERTKQLGGEYVIESHPLNGTRVFVKIPVSS